MIEIKGNTFLTKVRGMSLAAAVYFVWQEMNDRVFNQDRHDWQFVLGKIEEAVREVAWDWKSPKTFKNWVLCKEWGLHDVKVLSN